MNLGEIRTAVQAHGYGSDTASQQNGFINAAGREITGERRWWWREAQNNSLTMTAGTATLSTASIADLLDIDAVRLTYGSEYYDLDYAAPQDLRTQVHLARDPGIPQFWSFVNGGLLFWPYPDRAYTVSIDYLKDWTDLSADGDEPAFPAIYHDVLVQHAVGELARRERDTQSYGMAAAKVERLMDKMRKAQQAVRQRQSSRYVTYSGVFDTGRWH